MKWLRRLGRALPGTGAPPERRERAIEERSSPGVAALFEGLAEERQHAILDLGTAVGESLAVYSPFARWIRFADVLGNSFGDDWQAAIDAIPPNPEQPYDAIIGWDVLDRYPPQARPAIMARLAELASPEARLLLVVSDADASASRSLHFALLGVDRMRWSETDEPAPAYARLLPAQAQRALEPFRMKKAFSTQAGFREYYCQLPVASDQADPIVSRNASR